VDRLQARKQLLDAELAEGVATLELGDVQGHVFGLVGKGCPMRGR
jgi:hypothetical protein